MSYGSLSLLLSEETRSYTNSSIGTGDTCNEDDFMSLLVSGTSSDPFKIFCSCMVNLKFVE